MFTVFGAVALALTAVGLFSMISYGVAQRRREFSIRMAVGARFHDVRALILKEGLGVAMLGGLLGAAATLVGATRLDPLLFNVSARDPYLFSVAALLLAVVTASACIAPARRPARTDLMKALREE